MAPAVQTRLGAGVVTVDRVVAALDEEGFCIVEGLLPPDELPTPPPLRPCSARPNLAAICDFGRQSADSLRLKAHPK